ncbi:MAG: tetratricopeptide repeat protein [Myxococcota bacterium]
MDNCPAVANPAQAVKPLEAILDLDPGDESTLARLREIHEKRRNWQGLLDLMKRELPLRQGAARRALLGEMAKCAAERLSDPKEAIELWNDVLEASEDDAEALEKLSGLYEREKRWPELADVLRRQAAAIGSAPAALPLLEKLGVLCSEKLTAREAAVEAWQRILEIKPDHAKAVRALRDLHVAGEDWSALEALFAPRGAWAELCETLSQAADRADASLKLPLLRRVAEIAADPTRLGRAEIAQKAWERVLAEQSDSVEAARALLPLYEKASMWSRLLAMQEVLLEATSQREEQLALLEDIRVLCEKRLGSKPLAFQSCKRAFALDPDDAALRMETARLGREAGALEDLVAVWREHVDGLRDEDARTDLRREIAEVLRVDLGRGDEARGFYQQVLERRPDDREALAALEEILLGLDDVAALRTVLLRRAELEADAEQQVEILGRVAFIEEERLDDLAAAVKTYARIREIDPSRLATLRSLERLHHAREDWPALRGAYEDELDLAAEPAARAQVKFQLGQLLEKRMGEVTGAIRAYEDALELDASHRGAVGALEAHLAADDAKRVMVARLLAPHYQRGEDWLGLAVSLEAMAADEQGEARLEFLRRLVGIYGEKLDDAAGSYSVSARLLDAAPEDAENRAALPDRAAAAGTLADLAARLETVASKAEPELRPELWMECGELYDARLLAPEQAEAAYRKVLALVPDHAGAFDALRRILGGLERFDDLRDLTLARVEAVADGNDRRDLLLSVCEIAEEVLDDRIGAIAARERVLGIEPTHVESYKALERHFEKLGRFRDLEELLAREREIVGDADRLGIDLRRAHLRAEKLGDAEGMVDLCESILQAMPTQADAILLLERHLQSSVRLRAAELLVAPYEALGEHAKLVTALSVRREEAASARPTGRAASARGAGRAPADERFELTVRIAEVEEGALKDVARAFASWREALRQNPSDERPRVAIDRLAPVFGRWKEVAQAWEDGFKNAPAGNPSLRAELGRRVAEVYDERLRDTAKATEAWKAALEVDPDDAALAAPAAAALARLYEQAGEWTELAGILRRQAAWAEDAPARRPILLRVAQVLEESLGKVDDAIATHREILAGEPDCRDALDALERLFLSIERWPDLVETLRKKLDWCADDERRDLRARLALLYDEMLADVAQATSVYVDMLESEPRDAEALEALTRLYDRQERYADELEILTRRLDLAVRSTDRVALLMQMAKLESEKLGNPEGALDRHQAVLAINSRHSGALDAVRGVLVEDALAGRAGALLEPLYRAEGDHGRLAEIHEIQARLAAAPAEKIALLRRAAEVHERGVGDAASAFDLYRRAAREAVAEPSLDTVLADVERLAGPLGRDVDRLALLREIAPDIADPEARDRIHVQAADLALRLGDAATARDYYRRVLDSQPAHEPALDALEAIYQGEGDFEALLALSQQRADLSASNRTRRVGYLFKVAEICDTHLARPGDAVAAYEQVLQEDAEHAGAIAALERLYAAPEIDRFADLADLLEKRVGRARDAREAAALRFKLAEVYARRLREPSRALDLVAQVLAADQAHAGAIALAEESLVDPDLRAAAATILEPIYTVRHDWAQLVRAHELRLGAVADAAQRRDLLSRIARLCEEQLDDLERAFDWYGKAWREDPADRRSRDQILRLAGVLERWVDLAALFQGWLDDTLEDTDVALETARLLGSLYEERLAEPGRARDCYLRALRAQRDDHALFEKLEACLVRAGRWQELIDVYREMADAAAEPPLRRDYLVRAARVWEECLTDVDQAVATWRDVLEVAPKDAIAVGSLDRLYQGASRWRDLADLLVGQLEGLVGGDAVPLRYRLGTLHEQRLGDRTAAADDYEEVLKAKPDHREARAAFERLMADADLRLRAARTLQPLYRAGGEWPKLIDAARAEFELTTDKPRRTELLREIAQVQETRQRSPGDAYDTLAIALEEEFGDPEIIGELDRLAGPLGRWADLAQLLEGGIDNVYDTELQGALHGLLARIHEEELRDPGRAILAWRKRLSALEGDDVALDALDRLLEKEGRHAELVEILERKAELRQGDQEARKAILRRIADLQENALVRPELAIETWRTVLGLDDADRAALDALERLYLGAERWVDLVDAYKRKLELAKEAPDRRNLRIAIAGIYDGRLSDAFEAIATWRALLEQAPDDATALAALDRLYTNEENWAELVAVLDAEAQQAGGAARDSLECRAARVLEREIGDVEAAVQGYGAILERTPTHAEAREALEGLLGEAQYREAAGRVLEPIYRTLGDHGALVALCEVRAGDAAEPAARAALYREAAQIEGEKLRDFAAAFALLGRALAEEPGSDETLAELERLAATRDAFGELAKLYEERLDGIFDPELRRRYQTRLAQLCEDALGDDERAAAWHRKAIEGGADEAPALAALDRLYERGGKLAELAEVIERQSELTEDLVDQAGFLARLGLVREQALGDADGALAAYRDAIARDEKNDSALEGLERLARDQAMRASALDLLEPHYEKTGNPRKRIELAALRLTLQTEPSERVATLRKTASIRERELGDHVSALDDLLDALAADGGSASDGPLVADVERLAGETGRFAHVCARVEEILDSGVEGDAPRDLGLRCARWWRDRVGDAARAEARLRRVLAVDAEYAPALLDLEGLFRAAGRHRDVCDVLRRRAEATANPGERRKLLAEAASLLAASVGDVDAAAATWKAILELDENDLDALRNLADLCEMLGRYQELVGVLAQRARLLGSAEAVPLLLRIGELCEGTLRDLDRAGEAYRDALDHEPGNERALSALESIYRERGDLASVSEVLTRRLSSSQGAARTDVLRRLGAAAEEAGNLDEAIDYWRQVRDSLPRPAGPVEAPEDEAAAERLLGLYERTEKWFELCEALERRAEELGDGGDVRALDAWVRVAALRQERLEDVDGAAKALERVLAMNPDHPGALAGLGTIHERNGDWDKCIDVLGRALGLARSPAEAAEIHFRTGRALAEGRDDAAGAEAEYEKAVAADPTHAGALDAIERRARDLDQSDTLASVLEKRLRHERDPLKRLPLCKEIVGLYTNELGRPEAAELFLEEAASLAPDDIGVQVALGDMHYAAGRTQEAEARYNGIVGGRKGKRSKELAHVFTRLGAITEERGDLATAVGYYDEALKLDATHAPTLGSLGRLAMASGDWEKARKVYRSIMLGNLEDAAGLAKGELYLQLGTVHAKLGEPAKAQNMLERGLEADPGNARIQETLAGLKKKK